MKCKSKAEKGYSRIKEVVIDGFFKLKSRFTFTSEGKKKHKANYNSETANLQKYTCSLKDRNALSDTSGGALKLVMVQM